MHNISLLANRQETDIKQQRYYFILGYINKATESFYEFSNK